MVTVVGVCMIVDPAGFVVKHMRRNNKNYGKWEEHVLIAMPNLLGNQKGETGREDENGYQAMMMKAVPMPQ